MAVAIISGSGTTRSSRNPCSWAAFSKMMWPAENGRRYHGLSTVMSSTRTISISASCQGPDTPDPKHSRVGDDEAVPDDLQKAVSRVSEDSQHHQQRKPDVVERNEQHPTEEEEESEQGNQAWHDVEDLAVGDFGMPGATTLSMNVDGPLIGDQLVDHPPVAEQILGAEEVPHSPPRDRRDAAIVGDPTEPISQVLLNTGQNVAGAAHAAPYLRTTVRRT